MATSAPPAEDTSQIGQLFQACDLDGSGYIDERELASICSDLNPEEVRDIFRQLDKDGNGRITITEFAEGFKEIRESLLGASQRKRRESNNNERRLERKNRALRRMKQAEASDSDVAMVVEDLQDGDQRQEETEDEELTEFNPGKLDEGFTNLSCQEQVCDFYQQLHSSEEPQLVQRFEDILLSVIKDIRQQQCENDRLEKSFKREKEQHSQHLMQLEEELEVQMQKVESRVRHEERSKLESEKEDLKDQLETEISQLQTNLQKLQEIKMASNGSNANDEIRTRLEDMLSENRHLRSTLTDAQTNLALVKSEMAEVRHEYFHKCGELESEKDVLVEFVREKDSLSRQIGLMHDANQKLHDTNDDLRYALDTNLRSTPIVKRSHSALPYNRHRIIYVTGSRPTSASSMKTSPADYVTEYLNSPDGRPRSANSSLAEELGLLGEPSPRPARHLLPSQESCEVDSLPDDFDSGHSTLRDAHDMDSEFDPGVGLGDDSPYYSPRKRNRVLHHGPISIDLESMAESELQGFDDDLDGDMSEGFDGDMDPGRPPSRAASTCSKSSSHTSVKSLPGSFRKAGRRRRLSPSPRKLITAEPERMYKVVLCGDAAVGKSSFILRLCKDKFVSNLNSTLGVDFHTKTLEVDGRIIALQLWDTAGQERFRSIAKSYFRRADGVLLLYDVTYERSFINVRDWVEAVEDGAENVPIMLVGNKTDLREEYETERAKKCVRMEDGQRLAREFSALFIETSAKDGDNIMEAVTELSRLLRTNEDLEIKNVGMKLSAETKKSTCCSV